MTQFKKEILFISTNRSDFYLQEYVYNNLISNFLKKNFLIILDNDQKKILKKDLKKKYKVITSVTNKKSGLIHLRFADILKKATSYLKKRKPDFVVILGDRYEALSIALASYILKIKIIHIHGGEKTFGSLDQGFRDQISQVSEFHLVSNKIHKNNLITMGIKRQKIINIGSIGLAIIKNKITKYKIKNHLFFIVTLHPCDFDEKDNILIVLKTLSQYKNITFYFTKPNGEDGSKKIENMIKKYCKKFENFIFFENIGKKYPSMLYKSYGIIGNSSSGVIEASGMLKPVINLGMRQKNRVTDPYVISIDISKKKIEESMKKILKNNFLKKIQKKKSVYSSNLVAKRINDFFNRKQIYKN